MGLRRHSKGEVNGLVLVCVDTDPAADGGCAGHSAASRAEPGAVRHALRETIPNDEEEHRRPPGPARVIPPSPTRSSAALAG